MLPTCLPTVASVTNRRRAIEAFECPSASSPSTSRSRGAERDERVVPPPHELSHHLRVDGGPARADPAQRVDELLDVDHPVLEQVADATPVADAVAGTEQVGGIGVLHVLAQHDDGQARVRPAQLDRGPQALVGVRRAASGCR